MNTELRALRELFDTYDPAPPTVIASAYAIANQAGKHRSCAVMELVGDSADEPARVRAWRGAAQPRILTFMMPGRVVEVDLSPTTPGLVRASGIVISRAGQRTPAGKLALRYPEGECSAGLDGHGAFRVEDVPRGPVRVAFHPDRSTPAVADWLVW